MIITVANNKGGVAKTTTTVNTAAALVATGKRVLVLDMDAQRSAGHALGVDRSATPTMADVMMGGVDIEDAITTTTAGVDVVPASFELANMDVALAGTAGREKLLRGAVAKVRRKYDFIMIDTPPSIGLAVVNAVTAADAVLVPVTPHPLVLDGLAGMLDALERIRKGIGVGGTLLGVVLTMCDYRQGVTRQIVDAIRGHFAGLVFTTEIRQSVRLVEAPYFGQTIGQYAGKSTSADQYAALALEIIERTAP